ncbi:TetR/AcrR family transcriptional regulator [Microbacterium sp. ZXX196]|uniref:TetR family transcriptional regulator C-terminal domain-containing protein n=1 Tax=Microbacterium sp. ZXX196 TaxID=2609291 RepID=UPI0012B6C659|nr:TetR family transcriptional regulator [Microbacterium sp. ZXX196]
MPDLPPRLHVTRALLAVLADAGMDGVSVRRVAARAGLSIGAVQHHFATKAAMLAAAAAVLHAADEERDLPAAPRERLAALLDARIPASSVDPLARVWLALAGHAAVDDATNDAIVGLASNRRRQLAETLDACGASTAAARRGATELNALADGLAVQVVSERGALPPAIAREVLRARAAALTP